jgi:2,3-diaminopropionate biosynthesis protein SbnB
VFDFSVINGKVVHQLVHADFKGVANVIKEAYLTHHRKATVNPNSYFLRFPEKPDARIIALPAFLGGDFDVAGIKWIASFPQNVRKGIPRASAVLVLNHYDTGYPFACLESSIISAARTAASAVVAAEAMGFSRRQVRSIGFVGTGFIAKYVHLFLTNLGWRTETLRLFDSFPGEAEKFKAGTSGLGERVLVAESLPDLLTNSELIVLTTTAATPYITDPAHLVHNPVVLNISLRDVGADLILQSQNIVDDVEHVLNAGTSPHLAQEKCGNSAFINGTLAQLLLGEVALTRNRPTIFSPFGMGILDLALGKWVYDKAIDRKLHTAIGDFFFEVTR